MYDASPKIFGVAWHGRRLRREEGIAGGVAARAKRARSSAECLVHLLASRPPNRPAAIASARLISCLIVRRHANGKARQAIYAIALGVSREKSMFARVDLHIQSYMRRGGSEMARK